MRSNVYYVKRYPVASGVVVAGIRRAGLPAGVKIGPGDPADRGRPAPSSAGERVPCPEEEQERFPVGVGDFRRGTRFYFSAIFRGYWV